MPYYLIVLVDTKRTFHLSVSYMVIVIGINDWKSSFCAILTFYNIACALALCKSYWATMNKILNKMTWAFFVHCCSVIKEFVHAFSCVYIELWMHLGSLESTQKVRVALAWALSYSYVFFVLSKLPASIHNSIYAC